MDSTLPAPSTLQATERARIASIVECVMPYRTAEEFVAGEREYFDTLVIDEVGPTTFVHCDDADGRWTASWTESGRVAVRSLVLPDVVIEWWAQDHADCDCDRCRRAERLETAHLWAVTR